MNEIIDATPNISVITQIEVLRYNAPKHAELILNDFVSECRIINLDEEIVEQTIAICKSKRIKLPDAIIAATALVHELTLITRNTADFKNIEGLETLDPYLIS